VLDSVALEQRGIPTVTVVTKIFERAARAQAVLAGMPDLAIVVIPDKVNWQTDEELGAIADELLPQLVENLLSSEA